VSTHHLPSRIPFLLFLAAFAACSPEGTHVGFEWHLMPSGGDEHGSPSERDLTRVTGGPGTIRAAGMMPLHAECPRLEADIERDRGSIKIHVLARPPDRERGEVCTQLREPAMGEYAILLRDLRAGVYRVRVTHAQELPRQLPSGGAAVPRTRHSERQIADVDVRVAVRR